MTSLIDEYKIIAEEIDEINKDRCSNFFNGYLASCDKHQKKLKSSIAELNKWETNFELSEKEFSTFDNECKHHCDVCKTYCYSHQYIIRKYLKLVDNRIEGYKKKYSYRHYHCLIKEVLGDVEEPKPKMNDLQLKEWTKAELEKAYNKNPEFFKAVANLGKDEVDKK